MIPATLPGPDFNIHRDIPPPGAITSAEPFKFRTLVLLLPFALSTRALDWFHVA